MGGVYVVKPQVYKAQSLTLSLLEPFILGQWNPSSLLSPSVCRQPQSGHLLASTSLHKEPRFHSQDDSMSLDLDFEVLIYSESVYMDKETLAAAVCSPELGNARPSCAQSW